MIEVSVETLATVLTGLGLVIAIFSAMAAFSSTLRKEIKAVDENLRQEIGGLRGEIKTLDKDLRNEITTADENLRSEIKAVDENLRQEITGLRGEMKAELRSLNDRLDGTNLRIDRLVDSLRVPATA